MSHVKLVPTGTRPSRHARAEPLPTVLVPRPPLRRDLAERIKATLLSYTPGSDQSFILDSTGTVYEIAASIGVGICTRREGGKYRVWRIS